VPNWDSDTLEDGTGLTLGIFDDGILGFHCLFSLRVYRSLVRVFYQQFFSLSTPTMGGSTSPRMPVGINRGS
jgi:hypothetical protein